MHKMLTWHSVFLVIFYLASVFLFGYYIVLFAKHGYTNSPFMPLGSAPLDGYWYSEWVTDWSRGFVRRGMGGEAVEAISNIFSIAAPWTVWGIGFFSTLVFLFVVTVRTLFFGRFRLLSFAILLGPLGLPFLINNGLVMTKDCLVLLLFFGLFPFVGNFRDKKFYFYGFVGAQTALAFFAILIHEGSFFFLIAPLLFGIYSVGGHLLNLSEKIEVVILVFAVLFVATVVVVINSRLSQEDVFSICQAWALRGVPLDCALQIPGGLGALRHSVGVPPDGYEVLVFASNHPYWSALALVLIAMHMRNLAVNFPYPKGVAFKLTTATAVASIPIFVVAHDWGRFLFMIMSGVLLTLTFVQSSRSRSDQPVLTGGASLVFSYLSVVAGFFLMIQGNTKLGVSNLAPVPIAFFNGLLGSLLLKSTDFF